MSDSSRANIWAFLFMVIFVVVMFVLAVTLPHGG